MKRQISFGIGLLNLILFETGHCATVTNQPPSNGATNPPSADAPAAPNLGTPASTNGILNWRAAFSVGAEFLNPYVISVPSGAAFGTLTNAGNSTVGYLQFEIMRRWVFAPYAVSTDVLSTNKTSGDRWPLFYGLGHGELEYLTPDFQYDIGFLFANSVSSTNKTYSAQTLAGSDIYFQIAAGLPLWRNDWKSDGGIPVQFSAGGSVGVTTEDSFEKIHPNYFAGGTLDVGLPHGLFEIGSTNAPGLAEFRIGEACLDFPSLTGTGSQVHLSGSGVPEFGEKWVPEMGANVLIPFGSLLYLNVEANTFLSKQTPDQWNVKVGATIPWSSVESMFPFLK